MAMALSLANSLPFSIASWFRRNLFVVLLALACAVMGMLTFEQDRTIATQRDLIRSLYRDSVELNALKLERQQDPHHR